MTICTLDTISITRIIIKMVALKRDFVVCLHTMTIINELSQFGQSSRPLASVLSQMGTRLIFSFVVSILFKLMCKEVIVNFEILKKSGKEANHVQSHPFFSVSRLVYVCLHE